ncbi:oxygenase MpaB family protein [Nocardia sp. SYP-A9097]|uniref:oxygenase MpaB family protein n=1 Tax=Nocardia sp. SYP-A9097 TaxID=2663237 RepID=UPI00129A288B|nr:oxygenase MpaB family protein [Nocardia sp. SYP-A9097]
MEFHSEIAGEPYQRVLRSAYPILGVVFDGPYARRTARKIVGYHREIKGVDAQGRRYHALDPATFYWAHAVFFVQTLRTAELFMGGMNGTEREQLWREHYQWYELYGMSMRVVPESWPAFQRYWRDICRDTLEPTRAAWDVYNLIDTASVPPFPVLRHLPEPLWERLIRLGGRRLVKFVTVGLCDPAIRRTMGFHLDRSRSMVLRSTVPGTIGRQPGYPGGGELFVPASARRAPPGGGKAFGHNASPRSARTTVARTGTPRRCQALLPRPRRSRRGFCNQIPSADRVLAMLPQPEGQSESAGGHPFDYYYRPGMSLRPPPPRAVASELWYEPKSDPFWNRNIEVARFLVARVGINGTPFDHHDASTCLI